MDHDTKSPVACNLYRHSASGRSIHDLAITNPATRKRLPQAAPACEFLDQSRADHRRGAHDPDHRQTRGIRQPETHGQRALGQVLQSLNALGDWAQVRARPSPRDTPPGDVVGEALGIG
jgi:hypothetical protein